MARTAARAAVGPFRVVLEQDLDIDEEEARLGHAHGDLAIRRVILAQDLKREYQEFLQDHNRNRSDSDGRPDRGNDEIQEQRPQ